MTSELMGKEAGVHECDKYSDLPADDGFLVTLFGLHTQPGCEQILRKR